MLNQHHPDDERLSALASRDDDATAEVALVSHVESCARCTDLVTELGALRMSLAELPDLRPHRPLQLVPPVADDHLTDGAAGWIRRFFAPALTAGAALAMVGLIGTATPALDGMAAGGDEGVGSNLEAAPGAEADGAGRENEVPAASDATLGAAEGEGGVAAQESEADDFERVETFDRDLPAERSPWPMVLFTGVALMIGAALLRWILVPRAG
ncbi:MAG TPA: hypothetical protein VLA59_01575 [Patescibacteria group bacterium]|nr:hypothetical protein [Patescibacteria group bacterium]